MIEVEFDDTASTLADQRDEEDEYYQQHNNDTNSVSFEDDGFGAGNLPDFHYPDPQYRENDVTAVATSSSSWTVYEPRPKAMAVSKSSTTHVTPTYERDATEYRWRLARSLYSSVQNPHLLFPWERNQNNSSSQNLWPLLNRGEVFSDDDPDPAVDEPLVKRPKLTFAAHRVKSLQWEVHDDLLRQHALIKWRVLVEENLLVTTFGKSLHEHFEDPSRSHEIQMSLQDVFERKATATIAKRASSLMSYLVWSRKQEVQAPMNLNEAKIYRYVCHMRDSKAAPTAIRSFLESLVFA